MPTMAQLRQMEEERKKKRQQPASSQAYAQGAAAAPRPPAPQGNAPRLPTVTGREGVPPPVPAGGNISPYRSMGVTQPQAGTVPPRTAMPGSAMGGVPPYSTIPQRPGIAPVPMGVRNQIQGYMEDAYNQRAPLGASDTNIMSALRPYSPEPGGWIESMLIPLIRERLAQILPPIVKAWQPPAAGMLPTMGQPTPAPMPTQAPRGIQDLPNILQQIRSRGPAQPYPRR